MTEKEPIQQGLSNTQKNDIEQLFEMHQQLSKEDKEGLKTEMDKMVAQKVPFYKLLLDINGGDPKKLESIPVIGPIFRMVNGFADYLKFMTTGDMSGIFGKSKDGKEKTESKNSSTVGITEKIGETFKEYISGANRGNKERMKIRTDEQMKTLLAREGITEFKQPVTVKSYNNWGDDRTSHFHEGDDYPVPVGTDISSSFEGKVTYAGNTNGPFGNLITVTKGNITAYYAHLSKIDVKEGDTVNMGDIIGKSGNTGRSTGPHLHFEIRYGKDARLNPAQVAHVCSPDHKHQTA